MVKRTQAWVSEAMDLYARAMLMFDKRDRNMTNARQDRSALPWGVELDAAIDQNCVRIMGEDE